MKFIVKKIEALNRSTPRMTSAELLKQKRKNRRRRKQDRRSSVREGVVVSLLRGIERRKPWDRRKNG